MSKKDMNLLVFRIGCIIVLLFLGFAAYKGGYLMSDYKKPIPHQEIHYQDYVECISGFYTGTRGTVMSKEWYDHIGECHIYVYRGQYDHEIIRVKIKDLKKITEKEVTQ